jgi:hypothetical protein
MVNMDRLLCNWRKGEGKQEFAEGEEFLFLYGLFIDTFTIFFYIEWCDYRISN